MTRWLTSHHQIDILELLLQKGAEELFIPDSFRTDDGRSSSYLFQRSYQAATWRPSKRPRAIRKSSLVTMRNLTKELKPIVTDGLLETVRPALNGHDHWQTRMTTYGKRQA